MKLVMKKAGAGAPSANRITLLRDADGDGVAETRSVFLEGLNSPFGMALVGNDLYVANTDALLRFPYTHGDTTHHRAGAPRSSTCPAGPLNHHWTKNVIASRDGSEALRDRRLEQQRRRERHRERGRARGDLGDRSDDAASTASSPPACATRTAWPGSRQTGALWTVVNERDELGSDLVPDYLTSVRDGGFYGWPYSYYGAARRRRASKPQRPDLVAKAIVPDYALGPHTASLGLAFGRRDAAPDRSASGMFVGQHGSWNRKPRSGYKVIFVPFTRRQAVRRAGRRADRLPRAPTATPAAARSASRSTSAARCWSPTTSATRSGASPARPRWRHASLRPRRRRLRE